MKFTSVVIAVLAFCVQSFADEPDQSDYLPLKTGDKWTMDMVMTHPNGQIIKGAVRRRVEEPVEKNGKTYLRVRTWMEGGQFGKPTTKLMREDAEGTHVIEENENGAKEVLSVPRPIKLGKSWTRQKDGRVVTDTVIGLETIQVGEHSYEKCFHIVSKAEDGAFTEDYWEAPKVGSVKSEILFDDGKKISLALKKYKLGK